MKRVVKFFNFIPEIEILIKNEFGVVGKRNEAFYDANFFCSEISA